MGVYLGRIPSNAVLTDLDWGWKLPGPHEAHEMNATEWNTKLFELLESHKLHRTPQVV